MQKRKIFIEIGVPDRVKKRLLEKVSKWKDLPIKWMKPQNIHITIMFLGYVGDESIAEICQKASEASERSEMFDLGFNKIELGPDKESPRMIWATGEANEELRKLHNSLEKELGLFQVEKKAFKPHITLGKIRKEKWESLENKPSIEEKVSFTIPVESIEIMESKIDEEGNEYHIIESCPLS